MLQERKRSLMLNAAIKRQTRPRIWSRPLTSSTTCYRWWQHSGTQVSPRVTGVKSPSIQRHTRSVKAMLSILVRNNHLLWTCCWPKDWTVKNSSSRSSVSQAKQQEKLLSRNSTRKWSKKQIRPLSTSVFTTQTRSRSRCSKERKKHVIRRKTTTLSNPSMKSSSLSTNSSQ